MNLSDKLRKLMNDKDITRAELARQTGLPYTTIDSILRRSDFDKVKLSTLKALKKYFNVSLDYLIGDNREDEILQLHSISKAAYEVAQAYDSAEPRARDGARLALGLPPENEQNKTVNVVLDTPPDFAQIKERAEAMSEKLVINQTTPTRP